MIYFRVQLACFALYANAYTRICFIIASKPLLLVGDKCSCKPISRMKYKSASRISCGVFPESTLISNDINPFTIIASLSARKLIFSPSSSATSHTRLWQPSIILSGVLCFSSSGSTALPSSMM